MDERVQELLDIVGRPSDLTVSDLNLILEKQQAGFTVEEIDAARAKLINEVRPDPVAEPTMSNTVLPCPHCGKNIIVLVRGQN